MIGAILSWIAGGGLSAITSALSEAYREKLRAQTDEAKLEADMRIRELEARRDVILKSQDGKVERWVRVGWAFPFIAYNAKLVIYDKMLGWGVTDPLSPELATIQMTVIGGYFIMFTVRSLRK